MKELSIEEKAKRYDEALERAKEINNEQHAQPFNVMTRVFPELKEKESDDDERIRKDIISHFTKRIEGSSFDEVREKYKIWIAWLEKQVPTCLSHDDEIMIRQLTEYFTTGKGLQNTNDTVVEWLTDVKIKLEKQGEQEYIDPDTLVQQRVDALTNKVEPKFKVGDILVSDEEDRRHIYKVDAITNYDTYLLLDLEDGYTRNEPTYTSDLAMYLWTIQDAKDGDVIYLPNGNNEYYFFIFKGIENAAVKSFAHFYQYNDGTSEVEGTIDNLSSVNDVFQPATKEQRDLLFSKMKEAGYEWDAEKKELKKIKQEWSDEDEEIIVCLNNCLDELNEENGWCYVYVNNKNVELNKVRNWLKSIKDKYTWKPSEEQITWLYRAADDASENSRMKQILNELLSDLKKLKEE